MRSLIGEVEVRDGRDVGICEAKMNEGQTELFTTRLIVSSDAAIWGRVIRLRNAFVFLLVVFAAVAAYAQEPLHAPTPLVNEAEGVSSAGSQVADVLAARRAQEMGFPSAAIALYRRLLSGPGGDRPALVLNLATALLEEGRTTEAKEVLETYPGPRLSP